MRNQSPEPAERILEVAARLFGSHRFHEVRMDDIAAEADVGKGSLYRHFKDKEELYLALLQRAAQQIEERLRGAVDPVEGLVAKLQAVVETIIDFFDEQPHLFDLIQRAEVLHLRDFPWQHTREVVLQLVVDLLAEARKTDEFAIADPELAALMLLGGLRGVMRFGKRPRPADLARRVVTSFLQGAAHLEAIGPRTRRKVHSGASSRD